MVAKYTQESCEMVGLPPKYVPWNDPRVIRERERLQVKLLLCVKLRRNGAPSRRGRYLHLERHFQALYNSTYSHPEEWV